MTRVTQSIDVLAPLHTVYDHWTQFESFPHFMGGVESVTMLDEHRSHWKTTVGGVEREFDAVTVELLPDRVVSWRSTEGPMHAGAVTLEALDLGTTRVTAQIDWEPEGLTEKAGALLGIDDQQVRKDLERFKEYVEDLVRPLEPDIAQLDGPPSAEQLDGTPGAEHGAARAVP